MFLFIVTPTTGISTYLHTLSLHCALPISSPPRVSVIAGSAGVTGAEGRGRFAKICLSQGCDDRRLGRGARRRKPAASLAWAAQRARGCGGKDVTWEETPTERRRRRV